MVAAAPAEAATVIVKYRRGVASVRRHSSERAAGVRGVAGSVRGQGARVLRVAGDPGVAAARLRRSPGVLYAEPNAAVRALAAPDDPLFAQLDGLAAIHALAGWDALGLGSFPATGGVPVGIVDTGIDAGHEDLAGKVAVCATSRDASSWSAPAPTTTTTERTSPARSGRWRTTASGLPASRSPRPWSSAGR